MPSGLANMPSELANMPSELANMPLGFAVFLREPSEFTLEFSEFTLEFSEFTLEFSEFTLEFSEFTLEISECTREFEQFRREFSEFSHFSQGELPLRVRLQVARAKFFGHCDKIAEAARLHGIGRRSELHGSRNIPLQVRGTEDDYWEVREFLLSSPPGQDFESVAAGYFQVEEHEARERIFVSVRIGLFALEIIDGFKAVAKHSQWVCNSRCRERLLHQQQIVFVIINNQDRAAV
jgi:hypothetical protein